MNISYFQLFLKIISELAYLYSFEFWFDVTKTYATNVTLIFYIVFILGNNFIYTLFLTLAFSIIFKILILKNNSYWFRIFFICKDIVPQFCILKRILHFLCAILIIIYASKLDKEEFRLLIFGFFYYGLICNRKIYLNKKSMWQ